ncbi:hypothetical protein ABOM_003238 [Aspergillus bombycis]|uniref:Short-chain dehydrogenase/reductase family protein n=1 Tax=Aspergillus bombycis TaxID=109264 RepID=A0A1F8A8M4_9EURO|nr:hypothetical protein ABOM_003238 [Aspergillus bombycis]OGM47779.1 hypothetical protein ABOM_003238 [Aspergillus bombycis]
MTASRDLPPYTTSYYPNIYLKSQLCTKSQWPPKGTTLIDQVAIVTGANTGLGLESARQLLSYNLSHLIIAVRSAAKGETAASTLRKEYPMASIEVWQLDMSSYDSVRAFVRRTESQLSRLDIAILNAGLGKMHFGVVPSTGHEEVIQKVLSTPTLLRRPEDVRLDRAIQRIQTTRAHVHVEARRLRAAEDVVVNLVDPGFTKGTQLHREVSSVISMVIYLAKAATARTVQDGASTYVDATVVKGKEAHGCFLMDWQIRPFATVLYTPEGKQAIERLWHETMTELAFADVQGILRSMKQDVTIRR